MSDLPEYLQHIVARSPNAMAIVDDRMCYLAVSLKWIADFELDEKEIIGNSHYEIFPYAGGKWPEIYDSAFAGKASKAEGLTVSLDGSQQYLRWEVQPWSLTENKVSGLVLYIENLTQSKIKEENLTRTLNLLEKASKSTRIGAWEIDLRTNKLYWSSSTKEIHGLTEDFEPDLNAAFNFFKDGPSRDAIRSQFKLAVENGKSFDLDLQLVNVKGEEIWTRAKGEPEVINGRCIKVHGTFQDINEQKLQQMLLINSERKYRSMIETTQYGVLLTVPNEKVLEANQAAIDMFGYNLEEFRNIEGYEIIDLDDPAIHTFLLERGQYGKAIGLVTGIRKGGAHFPCELSSALFTDTAGQQLNSLVITDVTERKSAEEKIRLSEEQFRGAFEYSAVGMALFGLDGKWKRVNQRLCDMLGYTKEEFLEHTFQDMTYHDDLSSNLNVLEDLINGVSEWSLLEKRYLHKDGRIVYVLMGVSLLRDTKGEPLQCISQIQDITQRKIQENELISLNIELKALNSHKEKLLSVIGHDLRNPITSAFQLSELALMDEGNSSKDELLDYLSKIKQGLFNANMLMEDLLQWVKSQFNSLNFNPVRIIDLREQVVNCLKKVASMAEAKKIELIVDIENGVSITADKDMLNSIIRNLASNAIKFTSKGKVTIAAKIQQEVILFSVNDNGNGIAEEIAKKLFDKSFSYTTFGTSGEKGTGLGLDICKDFVDQHGGDIWVNSTIGVGSTFYFTIRNS